MIRDYERSSGIQGAAKSLVGERVVAVLFADNTINIFFESGCAVAIRAYDYGAIVMHPLTVDDTPAYVKALIRELDMRQADLHRALRRLTDCKCPSAEGHGDIYVGTNA